MKIRPSIARDLKPLSRRLRTPDKMEMLAYGITVEEGLKSGFENSDPCMTIIERGNPVGIFGVVPTADENMGAIWLVGTPAMVSGKNRFWFLRNSPLWVQKFHSRYPKLGNYIDSRNKVHIDWIKWLNFEIIGETDINGIPFYLFMKERD